MESKFYISVYSIPDKMRCYPSISNMLIVITPVYTVENDTLLKDRTITPPESHCWSDGKLLLVINSIMFYVSQVSVMYQLSHFSFNTLLFYLPES